MIEIYQRLIANCRTINQVNAVHIGLEVVLTPAEAEMLWVGLGEGASLWEDAAPSNSFIDPAAFKANAQAWVQKLRSLAAMSGKSVAEPFMRTELLKSVTNFSAGGDRRDKQLLLFFCGSGHIPMMPSCSFLQTLDASRMDVVFLKDYKTSGFRSGIEDLAPSMEAVWAALPANLSFSAYREVISMGVSGGGIMALLTALDLNLRKAIAVAPNSPDEDRWTFSGRSGRDRVVAAREANPQCELLVLFGTDAPLDRHAAEILRDIADAELLEIAVPGILVKHNALFPMHWSHRLTAFNAEQFGWPVPPLSWAEPTG
jgi:hypothetical protein